MAVYQKIPPCCPNLAANIVMGETEAKYNSAFGKLGLYVSHSK